MRIYISGKITGLEYEEYMHNFNRAEQKLKEKGFSVINPARVNGELPADTTYEEYMRMSFVMLDMADGIYMLRNWKESKGAKREYAKAKKDGKLICYEEPEMLFG